MSKPVILIAGAGQLGSRYLQGIAQIVYPIQVHVFDICENSLRQARDRWTKASPYGIFNQIFFYTNLSLIPEEIDIVVVATTASARPGVTKDISKRSKVRYWVLEKVLAQSVPDIESIILDTSASLGAWVNTPRRMMKWHQNMKASSGLNGPLTLRYEGGNWGLACNAVHFLDLYAWWTGEYLTMVKTSSLEPNWFETRRPKCWDISGKLIAYFSHGGIVELTCSEGLGTGILSLMDGSLSWNISEAEGVGRRSDGMEIGGRMELQSEMSAILVESLLETGECNLPTLTHSASMHTVFIDAMLAHWRCCMDEDAQRIPIT